MLWYKSRDVDPKLACLLCMLLSEVLRERVQNGLAGAMRDKGKEDRRRVSLHKRNVSFLEIKVDG